MIVIVSQGVGKKPSFRHVRLDHRAIIASCCQVSRPGTACVFLRSSLPTPQCQPYRRCFWLAHPQPQALYRAHRARPFPFPRTSLHVRLVPTTPRMSSAAMIIAPLTVVTQVRSPLMVVLRPRRVSSARVPPEHADRSLPLVSRPDRTHSAAANNARQRLRRTFRWTRRTSREEEAANIRRFKRGSRE